MEWTMTGADALLDPDRLREVPLVGNTSSIFMAGRVFLYRWVEPDFYLAVDASNDHKAQHLGNER
jgi:hypothetical protein